MQENAISIAGSWWTLRCFNPGNANEEECVQGLEQFQNPRQVAPSEVEKLPRRSAVLVREMYCVSRTLKSFGRSR